jgi:transposase
MSSALSVLPVRDPQTGVAPTRTRRRFSSAQKLQLLAAADACTKPGELGALLRRDGLYSSHLSVWRAAQRRGELQGPTERRGPVAAVPDPARKQVAALKRALATATARAERAELIIDAPKKFSQLLGLTLPLHDVANWRTTDSDSNRAG